MRPVTPLLVEPGTDPARFTAHGGPVIVKRAIRFTGPGTVAATYPRCGETKAGVGNCCPNDHLSIAMMCYTSGMNLAEWAESQGIARITAYRWFHQGKLPVVATKLGGLILVDATGEEASAGQTVVYARVSSADQHADLDRQVARVTAWATGQEMSVDRVVTEVGSALNGHRRKFLALLRE